MIFKGAVFGVVSGGGGLGWEMYVHYFTSLEGSGTKCHLYCPS